MEVGFTRVKDVDHLIISYLELDDIIILLKINPNFRFLIKISSIIDDPKLIDFMNNLISLNEHVLFDMIIDKSSAINCMDLDILLKFIEMSNFSNKLEQLIYNIISNTIENDFLPHMKVDKGMATHSLWNFIKRLLFINRSQFVSHIIKIIPINIFDVYNPFYIFQYDHYFTSHTIINYIKLLNYEDINWSRIQEYISYNLIFASVGYIIMYVTVIVNVAIDLKSTELIDIIEVICDNKNIPEINELINNAIKIMG